MSDNGIPLGDVQHQAQSSENDHISDCECVKNSKSDCLHNAVKEKDLE